MVVQDYIASGFFLSRYTGARDCTGIELRRVTLASDHSQRAFFPDSWALSWCQGTEAGRIEHAAAFGITERELATVTAWADQSFDKTFGAWSVFFGLNDARAAARSMLTNAAGLELWGVGLHRDLVGAYCEASRPPPQRPGYAPTGASGLHVATCVRAAPLPSGGVVLGHELLIDDLGSTFNSPESWHLDEPALFRDVRVVPNAHGLIDSFEDALTCCKHLDNRATETQHEITGWRPWLIVQYPVTS